MMSYLLLLLLIILGLVFGSFITMFCYRYPKILLASWRDECKKFLSEYKPELSEKISLSLPRSFCTSCHKAITWYYNVPLLGYLLQKGRCTFCHKPISIRYPLIEFITLLVTIVNFWHFGFSLQFLASTLLTFALLAASVIDLEYQIIPDQISLPLIWIGLFCNIFHLFTSLQSAVLGAIVGYLFLWIFAKLFFIFTKKEGMGYGDFKLLAVFGAWFGWQFLPLIILLSSLIGAFVGIIFILAYKKTKNTPIPFGPFIAFTGWLVMLCGKPLWHWYLNLMFR